MSAEPHERVTWVTPYRDCRQKSEQVEQMFDSIAPAYDFMNTAMSFGLHRIWRSKALDATSAHLSKKEQLKILDIATGTGDVAFDLHRRFPNATITGVDLSEGMLAIAEKKLVKEEKTAKNSIKFEKGDSLALRFPDNSFDLITVAYGVRNFQQLDKGLMEMYRVLKPGGMICIIELSEPEGSLTKAMYRLYARHLIPVIGKLVSGDSGAYTYLPESISAAPQREAMAQLMKNAGLSDCRWESLTFGAVTFYLGKK